MCGTVERFAGAWVPGVQLEGAGSAFYARGAVVGGHVARAMAFACRGGSRGGLGCGSCVHRVQQWETLPCQGCSYVEAGSAFYDSCVHGAQLRGER